MNATIVGGYGFIGSALARSMLSAGHHVTIPAAPVGQLPQPVGHVFYCAGVTADFRSRPFDTFEANTRLVAEILRDTDFDSFTYLSSARVYRRSAASSESAPIALDPEDPEDFYDFTKLTAEALCHASTREHVRIVRLTNVVGSDFQSSNFVSDLIRSACRQRKIVLRTDLDSAKDYVLLEDVVDMLPRIARSASSACYNLGSGELLTHRELAGTICRAAGAELMVAADAGRVVWPRVDTSRLQREFGYRATPVLPRLSELVRQFMELHDDQD